ncbi:unnamed protein product [Lactuca saligna]|uniref:Uncharacterized protein n=1 Tax=Lactuca saligna TaxID=75948 RepID=A0AA35YTA6_LACSI|nr:unnamed protein product [Lactuca saligna]
MVGFSLHYGIPNLLIIKAPLHLAYPSTSFLPPSPPPPSVRPPSNPPKIPPHATTPHTQMLVLVMIPPNHIDDTKNRDNLVKEFTNDIGTPPSNTPSTYSLPPPLPPPPSSPPPSNPLKIPPLVTTPHTQVLSLIMVPPTQIDDAKKGENLVKEFTSGTGTNDVEDKTYVLLKYNLYTHYFLTLTLPMLMLLGEQHDPHGEPSDTELDGDDIPLIKKQKELTAPNATQHPESIITILERNKFEDMLTRRSDPNLIIKVRCTKPKTKIMLTMYITRQGYKGKAVGQYTETYHKGYGYDLVPKTSNKPSSSSTSTSVPWSRTLNGVKFVLPYGTEVTDNSFLVVVHHVQHKFILGPEHDIFYMDESKTYVLLTFK